MMRAPSIIMITLFVVLRVQAQTVPEPSTYATTPGPDLVLEWLRSPDPRLQTWAAHDVLVYHYTALIPDLQFLLEYTTPTTLSDSGRLNSFRTTLAILDTLIQLGATVPAVTLSRIEKLGYNTQIEELVLLSRLPWEEAEPVVYSFYEPNSSNRYDTTRIAAQLLARNPPKGFAAALLSTILVSVHIVVRDPASGIAGGVGSGISSCCGASSMTPGNWPEIGRYAFQDPPREQPVPEDETIFLPAPDPVYLVRTVSQTYSPGVCGGFAPLNDAIRSHLVGTILGGNPVSPFPEQPVSLEILFKSRESYRAQVQALVDAQLSNFSQVAGALTTEGVLTEEERQLATLHMKLSVQDLRVQPAEDIPDLVFRPPIEWSPPN